MEFTWKIILFAGLAERFKQPIITLNLLQPDLTVRELKEALIQKAPEHKSIIDISFLAASHIYKADHEHVHFEQELALLPPVSGGESLTTRITVEPVSLYEITNEPILTEKVMNKVIVKENGASLLFVGTTREFTEGKRTVTLEYEAYTPMAIATMEQIGKEVQERWKGALCAITHRIGTVSLAEISVVIAVSTPHRDDCYAASRYAIERLKEIVPIWKREVWEDGSEWKGHQLGPWNPLSPPDSLKE